MIPTHGVWNNKNGQKPINGKFQGNLVKLYHLHSKLRFQGPKKVCSNLLKTLKLKVPWTKHGCAQSSLETLMEIFSLKFLELQGQGW
jgi:hypothetical protein